MLDFARAALGEADGYRWSKPMVSIHKETPGRGCAS